MLMINGRYLIAKFHVGLLHQELSEAKFPDDFMYEFKKLFALIFFQRSSVNNFNYKKVGYNI